jgi:IS5 family transposase
MCRPVAFLLTGGNVADCKAGQVLIDRMPPTSLLNADKGYDSDAIRRQVRQRGAFANIPPKANRKWKNCFSPHLYRTATPLSACSAGSRTSAASPPDTIDWLQTSSQRSASQQPSVTGYESGP